jgi:uncharacterized protein (TIGR02246 family)
MSGIGVAPAPSPATAPAPRGRRASVRWVIAAVAVLVVAVAGWALLHESGPVARKPLVAQEVAAVAGRYAALVETEQAAYETGDADLFLEVFADDVVHLDRTFGADIRGLEAVHEMLRNFMGFTAGMHLEPDGPLYISSDGFLAFVEMHPLRLRGHDFTAEEPLVEVDRYEVRDGRVTFWQLYYGLDPLRSFSFGVEPEQLAAAQDVLDDYVAAWSAGDPDAVAALYAPEALYEDGVFDRRAQGRGAISAYATELFAWYPELTVEVAQRFADTADQPTVGGRLALHAVDADGVPCDLHAAIVLETSADLIVREQVFHTVDSLRACGLIE